MGKRLEAVYKHGALYPLEPLALTEMQQVTLIIAEQPAIDEDLQEYFTLEEWMRAAHDDVTWDDVQQALMGIRGSLSDAVAAERQER